MPKKHSPKKVAYYQKRTAEVLAGMSPGNRAEVEAFLARRPTDDSASHRYQLVIALSAFDRFLNGASLRGASPDRAHDFLAAVASGKALTRNNPSPATHASYATRLSVFYKWAFDLMPGREEKLPREWRRVLNVRRPQDPIDEPIISEEEFRSILEGCRRIRSESPVPLMQAYFWVLYDGGFRREEAFSLRIDGLKQTEKGWRLTLRKGDEGLKTGARSVPVSECANGLRVWLAQHPTPGDPDAYIFPSPQGGPHDPPRSQAANDWLEAICGEIGLRHIHPHLFRHTRATVLAGAGANEAQLREFFGWGPNSSMPNLYVRRANLRLDELVRRQANVDPVGAAMKQDPMKALSEIAAVTAAKMVEELRKKGIV